VIGIYEPMVWLLADGTRIEGSLAARPRVDRDARGVSLLHRSCVAYNSAPGSDEG
jgi:hypothetical protein